MMSASLPPTLIYFFNSFISLIIFSLFTQVSELLCCADYYASVTTFFGSVNVDLATSGQTARGYIFSLKPKPHMSLSLTAHVTATLNP